MRKAGANISSKTNKISARSTKIQRNQTSVMIAQYKNTLYRIRIPHRHKDTMIRTVSQQKEQHN